jgi:predicted protein tyrosine phosphatase
MSKLNYSTIFPGHLYLGAAPGAQDVDTLRTLGVDAVLSLIHPHDPYTVPGAIERAFACRQIAIPDSYWKGVPTVDHLAEAVSILRGWRAEGKVIYLHCLLGQGRSPLVAMAYLVAGNDEEPDARAHRLTAAIAHVRSARPQADPNVHQLRVLCDYVAIATSKQASRV